VGGYCFRRLFGKLTVGSHYLWRNSHASWVTKASFCPWAIEDPSELFSEGSGSSLGKAISVLRDDSKSAIHSGLVEQHENTVATCGKNLGVISLDARELNETLESKNKVYRKELMQHLGQKLLNSAGAYWEFYLKGSVRELLRD
jgi:hypothetical protein